MAGEIKKAEVVEIGQRQEEQASQQMEKVINEFMGGLPYDQARVIERGQDGFEEGARGLFRGGMALLILQRNEGAQTFAQLLEQNFPIICRRTAENYIRIARTLAKHPAFKAFVNDRGGHSKLLTLLQTFSEEQVGDIAENEELLDKIDQMSNRQLKKVVRRVREKEAQAVKKAVAPVEAENAALRGRVKELEAEVGAGETASDQALKQILGANDKLFDGIRLLNKVDMAALTADQTVRGQMIGVCEHVIYMLEGLRTDATLSGAVEGADGL